MRAIPKPKLLLTLMTVTAVVIMALAAPAVYSIVTGQSHYTTVPVAIGEVVVQAYLADTYEKRMSGLAPFDSLPDNHGMLFVFDGLGKFGIWMKDMQFPIDILWFDADMKLVHIEENVKPESFFTVPPTSYYPDEAALYVLEVPAGFVAENRIHEGDLLRRY